MICGPGHQTINGRVTEDFRQTCLVQQGSEFWACQQFKWLILARTTVIILSYFSEVFYILNIFFYKMVPLTEDFNHLIYENQKSQRFQVFRCLVFRSPLYSHHQKSRKSGIQMVIFKTQFVSCFQMVKFSILL